MKFLSSVILCAASASPAMAQVAEIRAGIGAHDVSVLTTGSSKEKSGVITAEIIFEEPEFLKWALSPQPYINGTLNLGGKTSYGGAGLLWRQNIGKKFYGDFAFGLVVHDGTLDVFDESAEFFAGVDFSSPTAAEQFDAAFSEFNLFRDKTLEYGSRVLFREQLTLGYKVSDKWAVEGYFEHISHGNILSDGENDGSDAAGMRIKYGF